MKSRTMENESVVKVNRFSMIKEMFGSIGNALGVLFSKDVDVPTEKEDSKLTKTVQDIQKTPLYDDDVVVVTAGGKAKFGGISGYRANGNVARAVEQHNAKVNATKAKGNDQKEKGGEARIRGERV